MGTLELVNFERLGITFNLGRFQPVFLRRIILLPNPTNQARNEPKMEASGDDHQKVKDLVVAKDSWKRVRPLNDVGDSPDDVNHRPRPHDHDRLGSNGPTHSRQEGRKGKGQGHKEKRGGPLRGPDPEQRFNDPQSARGAYGDQAVATGFSGQTEHRWREHRACDQEVDRRMIEPTQKLALLGLPMGPVVERADSKERNHAQNVDQSRPNPLALPPDLPNEPDASYGEDIGRDLVRDASKLGLGRRFQMVWFHSPQKSHDRPKSSRPTSVDLNHGPTPSGFRCSDLNRRTILLKLEGHDLSVH